MLKSIAFCAQIAFALAAPWRRQAPNDTVLFFEAEDAVLSGNTAVLTELEGFSGDGYVGGFEAEGDSITFTVESDGQALYDLSIIYAGIYGDKVTSVRLNNGANEEVSLPETEAFETVAGGQVLLEAGENTIDILSNWGWYLIDAISLTPTATRPPHDITDSLVNPSADSSANALYTFLKENYGQHILSGQQELEWAEWVEEQVGKAPAILGLDMMDYSPSRVEYQGDIAVAVEEGIEYDDRGGILTYCWHWNAPVGLYDTDEQPWYRGFYTEATDFNIATALENPENNANYTLLIRDIDAIAEELLRLQEQNIPVLWRPLHEAEGAWFWWGAQGPEPAIELWNIMYDRMTNYHGLNNLIWVWNSADADWYPGDDVVDIISADVYSEGNGPMSSLYNQLIDVVDDQKIIAATEVGSAPLPDQLELYEAHWSWFCVWGDTFINDPAWNSPEVLDEIYNSDYTLTLDEIQGWRDGGS